MRSASGAGGGDDIRYKIAIDVAHGDPNASQEDRTEGIKPCRERARGRIKDANLGMNPGVSPDSQRCRCQPRFQAFHTSPVPTRTDAAARSTALTYCEEKHGATPW